jgi:hypothetical protein
MSGGDLMDVVCVVLLESFLLWLQLIHNISNATVVTGLKVPIVILRLIVLRCTKSLRLTLTYSEVPEIESLQLGRDVAFI